MNKEELLKDRNDYRNTLINKKEELEKKILEVEEQIKKIKG